MPWGWVQLVMPTRGAAAAFTSRGFANGSLIKNSTSVPLTDLHLEITSKGDTFSPKSTGGAAFPNVTISKDGTKIDFTGGNIPVGSFIWSEIPLTANFGGTGSYVGFATPQKAAAPAPAPAPKAPAAGSKTGLSYDGIGGIDIQTSSISFASYTDGTTVTTNNATETG